MGRKQENTGFICGHCGRYALPLSNGSYRNHCPLCLYSKHVDDLPGDRKNNCGGLMAPLDIRYNSHKGYQIVHRCVKCGKEKINLIARDTVQSDDLLKILNLMQESVVK